MDEQKYQNILKEIEETGCTSIKDYVWVLEQRINIPEGHHLVAVFENNDSDEIIGWIVAKTGVSGNYPVYGLDELIQMYGTK